ncbi:lipoprotein [Francisella philomiragia]|uniref:Type IV secretion system putative lipoprotein virB7 n=1 Tax=Francisella philomiragia TaxID=28110 RepID=A0ABS1GAB3_9GAMM|nr:membrane lipoprotein lipid attachment site-containing protein [Francisella philomiragia]MBK2258060.1 membrane lipoprotein lipid attachment site-containing protein [Francisella philomiragia]MBK2301751.1 membrane lipoprotein lipid attachment site-containing protein [Francisella philomiragia]
MKKILFALISIALLAGCSTTIINGSDYISMQPNTQYHYKRTALKANKSIFIDIDIESCNNDNTKCQYFVTVKNSKDKILKQYYETYYVNFFGDVYLTDEVYPNSTLLLPARITLGQEMLLDNGDRYGAVNEKLLAYKLIPEIQINSHKYENCVNILFVSTTPAESVYLKLVTDEVTCKDIGSVQKEMQMSYKPKHVNTSEEEISNSVMKFAATKSISRDMAPEGFLKPFGQKNVTTDNEGFILIDTYLDILESITHSN